MLDRVLVCVTPDQSCLTGNAFRFFAMRRQPGRTDSEWEVKEIQNGHQAAAVGEPGCSSMARGFLLVYWDGGRYRAGGSQVEAVLIRYEAGTFWAPVLGEAAYNGIPR